MQKAEKMGFHKNIVLNNSKDVKHLLCYPYDVYKFGKKALIYYHSFFTFSSIHFKYSSFILVILYTANSKHS